MSATSSLNVLSTHNQEILLLAQLIQNNIVALDLLLNGNTLLDYDSNKSVILAVLHFIKSTRRFS